MHRVLKPGAAFRIVVPSLEKAIDAYVAQRSAAQTDPSFALALCPSRHGDFKSRGAHFNWETLCDNQHPVMLDFTFLAELLNSVGAWTEVHEAGPQRSLFMSAADLNVAEGARLEYIGASLVVEGRKAGAAAKTL
jgi:hypothetical protein